MNSENCFVHENIMYSYWNGELTVVGINNNTDNLNLSAITIASELRGMPVVSIGVHAFANCMSLTDIIIPGSVKTIGPGAFEGCTSLKKLIIRTGVTAIKDFAFYGCKSLKSVKIPDSVTNIDSSTFYECNSLKSIEGDFSTFPPKLEFINLLDTLNKECCYKNKNNQN